MDSDSEARAASRCVWTEAEDQVLRDMAEKYKGEYWNTVARAVGEFAPPEGQRKTAKQCRERWHNQLNPVVHLGPLTSQEEAKVFSLHQQFGNRWSKIAGKLPGRTDNVVKNYFFCRLRKLVRCIKHGKGKALYPKSDDELVQTLYLLDYLYKYYVSPKRLENISHTLNSQTKRRKNNGDKYINKMVVDEGITAEKIGTFSLTLLATSPPASKALDLQAYAYMQELALNDGTSPANLCGQSAHAEDSKSGTTEARSGDVINSDACIVKIYKLG